MTASPHKAVLGVAGGFAQRKPHRRNTLNLGSNRITVLLVSLLVFGPLGWPVYAPARPALPLLTAGLVFGGTAALLFVAVSVLRTLDYATTWELGYYLIWLGLFWAPQGTGMIIVRGVLRLVRQNSRGRSVSCTR